jgi:hypothetical protein
MPKRKSSPEPAGLSAISTDDAKRYRAEEAMRTLMRASEHMKDKALMRDVKRLAKTQAAALHKVAK